MSTRQRWGSPRETTRTVWTPVLAAVALLAGLAAPTSAQERFEMGGDMIAVYNLVGNVEVVRGSGANVVVEVTRGGADGDRLTVEVDRIGGRNALRVVYPFDELRYTRGGSMRSDVQVRADGTFGGGDGAGRTRRVRVTSERTGAEAWADLTIRVPAGRDLQVWGVVGDMEARGTELDALLLDTHAGRVRVEDLRGDFEADTGSGSVRVSGVVGDVEIDTGSGLVEVDDVQGDLVFVDTGSGNVTATRLTASEVEIDTGSGNVEVDVVGPSVARVLVDTGSGGVTVRVPRDLDAEIEVDTGSGGIDIDVPVEVLRTSRSYFHGRAGAGRGSIVIDTGSGRVQVIGG